MGRRGKHITWWALKKGMHIFSYRNGGIYHHSGIVVETGHGKQEIRVIATTGAAKFPNGRRECETCQFSERSQGVVMTCLDCFLKGEKLYHHEYGVNSTTFVLRRSGTCSMINNDPPGEVLHRAMSLRDNCGKYNFVTNNCENFAAYCSTGIVENSWVLAKLSGQVKAGVGKVGALIPIAIGFRWYRLHRLHTSHFMVTSPVATGMVLGVAYGGYTCYRIAMERARANARKVNVEDFVRTVLYNTG